MTENTLGHTQYTVRRIGCILNNRRSVCTSLRAHFISGWPIHNSVNNDGHGWQKWWRGTCPFPKPRRSFLRLVSILSQKLSQSYPLFFAVWFGTNNAFLQRARNARIASAVLATAIPSVRLSVCLSVRHTPVLCQNDGT